VSGVNTISFAIDFEEADTAGLLGFAVERHDLENNERYYMRGFKVFKELIPHPGPNTEVSTYDHPVQSFVWDDFTAKPDNRYIYYFHPIKGKVKHLDRSAGPIEIPVQAEPLYSDADEHDVFFNRGVASSQAYAKKFGNVPPDKIKDPAEREKAYAWLSRDLKDAMIKFISQAKDGDTLLGCFYEFRYKPIADAFKMAINRGVHVSIIIDAKANKEGFPRKDNLKTIKDAGIPLGNIIKREANKNDIQHNKFIILLEGNAKKPVSVWTGSTNISEGGIFGQTNVGHWVKNESVAASYNKYWDLLSNDPGGAPDDSRSEKIKKNKEFKNKVVAIKGDIAPEDIASVPKGITPIFSPRQELTMLNTYAQMLDDAHDCSCITLAFGINEVFKEFLDDNTQNDQVTFMLLEKKDKPNPRSKKPFIYIGAGNNVYKAWGSYIQDPLYQWTEETNTKIMQMNSHVLYVHSKFLLADPLSDDPIVVTGSANFSEPSTTANDENMLIIRGSRRAADIYFTEFNRLFNHYYFRAVQESVKNRDEPSQTESLFLSPESTTWLKKYQKGKLKYKRVKIFAKMKGAITLG
jgi:phosphatidylserine/phosphatidylglycerophosphate/cardiolipin synthase-like enzyme